MGRFFLEGRSGAARQGLTSDRFRMRDRRRDHFRYSHAILILVARARAQSPIGFTPGACRARSAALPEGAPASRGTAEAPSHSVPSCGFVDSRPQRDSPGARSAIISAHRARQCRGRGRLQPTRIGGPPAVSQRGRCSSSLPVHAVVALPELC